MLALYDASARSVSRLLPSGGLVLDLGCGSGRFAAHLAQRRPDVRIVGLDLADTMLHQGTLMLQEASLDDRVTLRRGDMCDLTGLDGLEPAVVCVNMALHHLQTVSDLEVCARELAGMTQRTACAVWLFDMNRLRDPQSYHVLLDASPEFSGKLLADALASEAASWTSEELRAALLAAGLDANSATTAPLALFQSHWQAASVAASSGHEEHWCPADLPELLEAEAAGVYRQLGVKLS
jgi:tRNA (cmo5U34)-methyltransferase